MLSMSTYSDYDTHEEMYLAAHQAMAANLGKSCAEKRVAYYTRGAEASEAQAAHLRKVAAVYEQRASVAPDGDCPEE